jgi:hypothetical protein
MKFSKIIKSVMNFDKSKNKKSLVGNLKSYPSQLNSYFYNIGKPVWMERNYQQFAQEAYTGSSSMTASYFALQSAY